MGNIETMSLCRSFSGMGIQLTDNEISFVPNGMEWCYVVLCGTVGMFQGYYIVIF